MKLHYGPRGILEIDDARILFPNFEGRESMYNRKGDRNFSIAIDDFEMAEELYNRGWNIKVESGDKEFVDSLNERGWGAKLKPDMPSDEPPRMRLNVKVKYTRRDDGSVNGPKATLLSGRNEVELDEESIGTIDHIDRERVDLDIRPYDWELPSGKSGRSAYLSYIEVVQRTNRFEARSAARRAAREEDNYDDDAYLPF